MHREKHGILRLTSAMRVEEDVRENAHCRSVTFIYILTCKHSQHKTLHILFASFVSNPN